VSDRLLTNPGVDGVEMVQRSKRPPQPLSEQTHARRQIWLRP